MFSNPHSSDLFSISYQKKGKTLEAFIKTHTNHRKIGLKGTSGGHLMHGGAIIQGPGKHLSPTPASTHQNSPCEMGLQEGGEWCLEVGCVGEAEITGQ